MPASSLRPVTFTALFFVFVAAAACGPAEPSKGTGVTVDPLNPPARSYWPTRTWQSVPPAAAGLDPEKFQKAVDYAMTNTAVTTGTPEEQAEAKEKRRGIRTDGLVIVRNGKIVGEAYGRGYTEDTPHLSWSVAKSFTQALIGTAVRDGILDLDGFAHTYYPALDKSDRRDMRVRHLLNMSSGLFWAEDYEYAPLKSDVVAMLYTRGQDDMPAFVADRAMRAEPGTFVFYSSGDTNLLHGILRGALNDDERYTNYPWQELFDVLGMQSAVWERDPAGNYVGSSYVYATPRDLAKFGFLYLNDGTWDGKRLLPEGWVDLARTPAPGYAVTELHKDNRKYLYTAQWYANTGIPTREIPPPWPDAPRDTFAALGHWGQKIFVIPSLDLVIVRTGDDRESGVFDNNKFLRLLKESVVE